MTFGAEFWGPILLNAGLSAGSSYLSNKGKPSNQTPIQQKQGQLVDTLISSLGGQGPYADLFNLDEAAFKKSFTDPAMSRFKNQIAPGIQQQYIAYGQQRSDGLDDQLLRAGVDLNSQLDQFYFQGQEAAKNRKVGAINSVLGQSAGAAPQATAKQDIFSGLGGYAANPDLSDKLGNLFKSNRTSTRKGFIE